MTTDDGLRAQTPSGVGPPARLDLPLFVYGLLKPGELAYRHVVGAVESVDAHVRDHHLVVRDGLPLLVPAPGSGPVRGALLRSLGPADMYANVGDFEPRKHYRWAEVSILPDEDVGAAISANTLLGRSPAKGTERLAHDEWSSRLDPALSDGLRVVSEMLASSLESPIRAMDPQSPELWNRFFRLSATYLLLWSIIERATALMLGPGLEPTQRVKRLDALPEFRAAAQAAGVRPSRKVFDSRDPSDSFAIKDDWSGAAQYWYAVRSNLSHRGKAAFRDGELLQTCAIDARNTLILFLGGARPELKAAWGRAGDLIQRSEL